MQDFSGKVGVITGGGTGMGRALADMLDAGSSGGDAWPAMRERARAYIAQHRDWSINSRRYLAVYHRLLGKPADRSPESAAWMHPETRVRARQGAAR